LRISSTKTANTSASAFIVGISSPDISAELFVVPVQILKERIEMNKDLNELKQKYAELGEKIKRLEDSPKPWPQVWDRVFVLNPIGDIVEYLATHHKIAFIAATITQGNGFRTRAEAEAEKHYRDVAYQLSQQEGARKFVKGKLNYVIRADSTYKLYSIMFDYIPEGRFYVYFDKREQAENALATVGEQEIIRAIRWKELGETA